MINNVKINGFLHTKVESILTRLKHFMENKSMDNQENNLYTIPDLTKLIEPNLKFDSYRILSVTSSRLNNRGTSKFILISIKIRLLNITSGEEWTLDLVAETLPRNKDDIEWSSIQKSFRKEYKLLMTAKPALEQFLSVKGIKNGADFFPTTYGGRLNLSGNDEVDFNAAIVIQDYNSIGLECLSREACFDYETSKLIIKGLAKFHATFLSYKTQEPKRFDKNVLPYLENYYVNENTERCSKRKMLKILKEQSFPPDVIDRAILTFNKKSNKETREPWATFIHSEPSVNNILIGFDIKNQPTYIKFLDFTKSEYSSPLRDLLFFLFSSVELSILENHLDDLIDFYYYTLTKNLKFLNVDGSELFCRLAFNRELKAAAGQSEFYKLICMMDDVLSSQYYTENNCDNSSGGNTEFIDSFYKSRLCYIVKEFDKKGWLYF